MAKIKKHTDPPVPAVEFIDDMECQRCGAIGAADFLGDILCPNCIAQDVFEDYDQNKDN